MQKKCKNIWSIQKFVVPLHPLSLKNGARPKRVGATIFEKMSIITRCSTRTEINGSRKITL